MITWVTVWVLTLTYNPYQNNRTETQYTYATESICKRQGESARNASYQYECRFQQVPVYVPKGLVK